MSAAGSSGKRTTIETLQEFSVPLIAGVLIAIIWANVDPHGYHQAVEHEWFGVGTHLNLHFFANEILMVFFFGVAAKEITEACLPGGALNPPRKAVNPLMGTVGGVVGPIVIYFVMSWLLAAPEVRNGWGIPTATDIALAWLVARLVFGARHPAVSYLLLLAVADDALGLAIIAVFYPDPAHPTEPMFLGLVAAAMVIAYVLKMRGVRGFWPYVIVGGGLSWTGLYLAHLHPALALVPIVPFMPNRGQDEGLFSDGDSGYTDALNRFEHFFKAPVDFGLMTFGLANAGVPFAAVGAATWSVVVALLVGKTLGITVFAFTADKLGFSLPKGMRGRTVVVAGLVAGLGLTVALFVAGAAFTDPELQGAAKMGALLSSLAAPLAIVLAKLVGVQRRDTIDSGEPEPVINPSGRPSLRESSQPSQDAEMDLGPPSAPATEPGPEEGTSRG